MSAPEQKKSIKEIIGPANTKRILISVLGTLVIVFLVNLVAFSCIEKYSIGNYDLGSKEKWNMLLNLEEPVEWLILGDSTGLHAVVPNTLNERLGVTSINLCTLGFMGVMNDAWMLNRYIQQFGSPKNVIIVHFYKTWQLNPIPKYIADLPLEWGFWNGMRPPLENKLGLTYDLFMERYVPVVTQDDTLVNALRGYWLFERALPSLVKPSRLQADGLLINTRKIPGNVLLSMHQEIRVTKDKPFFVSNSSEKAIDNIVALAEEHGFDVYLAHAPLYEGLYENQDFQTYFTQVQDKMKAFADISERLYYISNIQMTFPEQQMLDATHVMPSAALVFTDSLITAILSEMECAECEVK